MLQDQPIARQLILEGLGGHFGFIDETMNPDLDDMRQQYVASGNLFVVVKSNGVLVSTGGIGERGKNGRFSPLPINNQ